MWRPRRRRPSTEAAQVAGEPRASSDKWAPPPVSSRTACAVSGVLVPSTHSAAPNFLASASAWGEMSTATTLAPAAAAIITADRPTPPQPCTATHSPGATRPRCATARNAVANRQPSEAAVAKVIPSGIATRFTSAWSRATYWAKEPQWVKPGWVWRSQTCWSPAAQVGQVPQAHTNGTVTRSPGCQSVTRVPTVSTTPASSWPGT